MNAFAWLFAATWKGSLLIAVVFCIFGITARRIPAKWRHALLLLALIRLVLPVAPESSFSIFNLAVQEQRPFIVAAPQPRHAFDVRELSPPPKPQAIERRFLTNALLLVWVAGAVLVLLRLAVKTVQLRRRLRLNPAQPLIGGARDLLEACREMVGVRRRVSLASTAAVSSPSLLGFFRPALLLPPEVAETLTPDQLRFIFLHELAHLRRFDVLVNWFVAVIQALHWFNPLVWIAMWRLDEERELACDALALEHLNHDERSAYGETVIQLLDQLQPPRMVPGLVAMTSTKQQLKRRIQMIATFRNTRTAIWSAALVAVFAVVTLTDAQAGGRRLIRAVGPMSPEEKATVERLNQTVTAELREASLDDILFSVTKWTGVTFKVADGAIDDRTREARIDMTAKNIPAHVVVIETLSSLGLGIDFKNGATIVKTPARGERFMKRIDAPGPEAGVVKEDVIFIRKADDAAHDEDSFELPELPARGLVDVEATSENGVIRRKVTFRESKDQPEGTLDLEVRRGQ